MLLLPAAAASKTAGTFADNTEHDMCRFTACPAAALFDGGLKYMCNNTLVENQTEPYTASMATLLMKTDVPSSDTSASGSLMTLRKDVNKSLGAPTIASHNLTGTVPEGTLEGGGTLPNGQSVPGTDTLDAASVSAGGSAVGTLTVADHDQEGPERMHLLRHNAPVSQQRRDGGDDKAGGGGERPLELAANSHPVTRLLQ
jgi:hypothetical protein